MKQANPASDGQAGKVGVLRRIAARLLLEINGGFSFGPEASSRN